MSPASSSAMARLRSRLRFAVRRTGLVAGIAAVVALFLAGVGLMIPGMLPLRASTGIAVGIIAWLTGMSLASFVDGRRGHEGDRAPQEMWTAEAGPESVPAHPEYDVRVHVPKRKRTRRVRTPAGAKRSGADVAIRLQGDRRRCAADLARQSEERTEGSLVVAAVAPADDHPAGQGWGPGLAEELARRGRTVLFIDLVAPTERQRPGVTEVARGQSSVSAAVEYHRSLRIARLGPGRDSRSAAAEIGMVLARPPVNVQAIVIALPPLGQAAVPAAARHLQHITFFTVRGRTKLDTIRDAAAAVGEDVEVVAAVVDPERGDETPVSWDPEPPRREPRAARARHLAQPDAPTEPTTTNGSAIEPGNGRGPAWSSDPARDDGSDLPTPERSEVWGREIAHASEELDDALAGEGPDPTEVWGSSDGLRATVWDEAPTPDVDPAEGLGGSIDPAEIWGLEDDERAPGRAARIRTGDRHA